MQVPANSLRLATSIHPVEFIEPIDEKTSDHLATEAIARVFAWVADGRTLEDRGFRSTVAIFTVRPDLFGGVSLERLGESTGRTKQATWKLQVEFRRAMGMEVA